MSQVNAAVGHRLKSETQDLHDAAENHEFQRALFKGQLPLDRYIAYLGQMLLVHEALERRLIEARADVPAIDAIVESWQLQAPYLRADLEALGADSHDIAPLPATSRLIERIKAAASESPLRLLGHHYVLEGSNNGSRYIAINVRKAYDLTPGRGDQYLDPYGDQQRARWASFKESMAGVVFTGAEADELVDAAREMFEGIAGISGDLGSPVAAA